MFCFISSYSYIQTQHTIDTFISYVGWSFETDFLLITNIFSKLTEQYS